MEYVIAFFVYTAISWIFLMIVLPIARNIVDFSLPPMGELAWRAAVVAGAGAITDLVLSPISGILALVGGLVVFYGLMYKFFDIGLVVFYGLMYKFFDSGLFATFVIAILNTLIVFLLFGVIFAAVSA